MNGKEKVTVHLNEKIITLYFDELDQEIDVDDLTKIHYDNLYGEMVTVSVLLNRMGLLKAEAQNALSEADLDYRIYKAQIAEMFRKNSVSQSKSGSAKYPTKDEVDNLTIQDKGVQNRKKIVIRKQKEFDYMDSLYWAVKSKDTKLNRLIEKIVPSEFEKQIVEEKINGMYVRVSDKLIK